jgi:FkbM family methyltransferase
MKRTVILTIQKIIAYLTVRVCGPHATAITVNTEHGLYSVDPHDSVVGLQLRAHGTYGTDEINRIKPYISEASRVLIVGAHIGTLAIPLARHCKEVVAIEANPHTYGLLSINIRLNDIDNCQILNIAASDKTEEIPFLLSTANSGGSKRVPKNKEHMYYYDNPKEITVTAHSLDEYLDNHHFDAVIMDIEGSEYFALKGMQDILGQAKVLAVEFLPHHLKNVSGATVAEFVDLITPHFSHLSVPTKDVKVAESRIYEVLETMYANDEGDDAIVFSKSPDGNLN